MELDYCKLNITCLGRVKEKYQLSGSKKGEGGTCLPFKTLFVVSVGGLESVPGSAVLLIQCSLHMFVCILETNDCATLWFCVVTQPLWI